MYNDTVPLTAEQIAAQCDYIDNPRSNRAAINKLFRAQDDSHLWPINSRFNVTERAIKRAQWFNRETGNNMAGFEYALFLEEEQRRIVNDENNW